MTIITFKKDMIRVEGHSGYGTTGNDIVCSAISSISTTTVRAILKYNSKAIDINSVNGLLNVKIKDNDLFISLLIDNMKELLKELKEQYPKFVEVIE